MQIKDSITLDASGLSLTKDGYLVGEARVSRAGNVQHYMGSELGLTGDDAVKVFGVYRDPDVVFDESSMLSLAGRPVTRNHPDDSVSAKNWKDLTVGQVGGTIRRDGEHVVAPMAIMDADAVNEVANGARSLSAGYTCEIIADSGISPSGEKYEYRQSGPLRFNHVAYLPDNNPRAGNTRIGDGKTIWGISPVNDSPTGSTPTTNEGGRMADSLKTVVIGDQAVKVSPEDVAAIEQFKTDSAKALADAESKHETAIAAKDAEMAKLQAQLDDAKGKILSDADIDKRVADRADLVTAAKALVDGIKTEGVADADIRKAVVAAKFGDESIADKSAAYIDARFDILVEDAKKEGNPVREAIKDSDTNISSLDDSRNAYLARMTRKEA